MTESRVVVISYADKQAEDLFQFLNTLKRVIPRQQEDLDKTQKKFGLMISLSRRWLNVRVDPKSSRQVQKDLGEVQDKINKKLLDIIGSLDEWLSHIKTLESISMVDALYRKKYDEAQNSAEKKQTTITALNEQIAVEQKKSNDRQAELKLQQEQFSGEKEKAEKAIQRAAVFAEQAASESRKAEKAQKEVERLEIVTQEKERVVQQLTVEMATEQGKSEEKQRQLIAQEQLLSIEKERAEAARKEAAILSERAASDKEKAEEAKKEVERLARTETDNKEKIHLLAQEIAVEKTKLEERQRQLDTTQQELMAERKKMREEKEAAEKLIQKIAVQQHELEAKKEELNCLNQTLGDVRLQLNESKSEKSRLELELSKILDDTLNTSMRMQQPQSESRSAPTSRRSSVTDAVGAGVLLFAGPPTKHERHGIEEKKSSAPSHTRERDREKLEKFISVACLKMIDFLRNDAKLRENADAQQLVYDLLCNQLKDPSSRKTTVAIIRESKLTAALKLLDEEKPPFLLAKEIFLVDKGDHSDNIYKLNKALSGLYSEDKSKGKWAHSSGLYILPNRKFAGVFYAAYQALKSAQDMSSKKHAI